VFLILDEKHSPAIAKLSYQLTFVNSGSYSPLSGKQAINELHNELD
jgi:hypothetical protein